MFRDTDINWISVKDLRKKKMCQMCHKRMTVKQINLTEACRSCFNEECRSQPTDVPEFEYIIRSYRDMEFGIEKQGRLNVLIVSLENEVNNINKLFSEVENMVSHRLGREYWSEMNIPCCSKKQKKDLNGLKFSEKLSHDKCDRLDSFTDDRSQHLKTENSPTLHIEQLAFSNGISTNIGLPNIPQIEEKSLELPWSLHTGNTNTMNSEQTPATGAVWDNLHPTLQSEGKSFELSWSPHTENSTSIHMGQTPAVDAVWENVHTTSQSEGKSLELSWSPHIGTTTSIHIEQTPATDAVWDNLHSTYTNECEKSSDLPLSVFDSVTNDLGQCANDVAAVKDLPACDTIPNFESSNDNIELKPIEILEYKSSSSTLIQTDVKMPMSNAHQEEDKSNVKTEVTEDINLHVKITSGFRCYRPKKGLHRKIKAETETKTSNDCNLIDKWSNLSVSSELDISSSQVDQPMETKENFDLFKNIDADFQESSLQCSYISVVQPLDQLTEFQKKVVLPEKNGAKANDKLQSFKKDINVNVPLKEESTDILILEEPLTSAPKKGIKSLPKGKKKVPKPVPVKSDSGSSAKTSPIDAPKKKVKPILGFNELRSFGGAKCSLPTAQAKSKTTRKLATRRKKTNNGKTGSNSVNDDIEKAIAKVQHSSVDQNMEWDQMFLDILN